MAKEVSMRLKAPPNCGRGRSMIAAVLRHVCADGCVVRVVSKICPSSRGLRKATRKPWLMARSLIFSSSRSLLATTTMLFLEWQSRKITKVLCFAVCPAVVCVFCISVKHLKIWATRKRSPLSLLNRWSTTRGLIYERATAEVLLGEGNKKSPRCVLGCFRRPCVMVKTTC